MGKAVVQRRVIFIPIVTRMTSALGQEPTRGQDEEISAEIFTVVDALRFLAKPQTHAGSSTGTDSCLLNSTSRKQVLKVTMEIIHESSRVKWWN